MRLKIYRYDRNLMIFSYFADGNGSDFESGQASSGGLAAADRDSGDELSGTEEVGILLERIRSRPAGIICIILTKV
jgi:hypothetical protein